MTEREEKRLVEAAGKATCGDAEALAAIKATEPERLADEPPKHLEHFAPEGERQPPADESDSDVVLADEDGDETFTPGNV